MNARKKLFIINSIIIVLLGCLTVFGAWLSARTVLELRVKDTICNIVDERVNKLEESNGEITPDFDFSSNDVYVSLYTPDGRLINAYSIPTAAQHLPLRNGEIQTTYINSFQYYVYDFEVLFVGGKSVVVRGVARADVGYANAIVLFCGVLAFAFIMFAIIASLIVIKNAVRPIERMTYWVNRVVNFSDLSLRIPVSKKDKDVRALQIAYNKMLKRLEELFKNQERFTSDVSHELRTPLTVILAEAEFALDNSITEQDRRESLETICTQTKKLVSIVNQILEFSRFANAMQVDLISTDISALTLDSSLIPTNAKNVTLITDVDEDIVVPVERTLYQRLVQNLVDNAVKYSRNGGVVTVTLKRTVTGGIVLAVRDNGIGMSEETKSHAFDRFYQQDTSRTSSGSGLGLGLSFAKEICRLFGAKITVDSELGIGSTFFVSFDNPDNA